ncbi:molybdopterin converting factor subunit 1 [soil metagenome]
MKINLVAFGIAKDILQSKHITLEFSGEPTIFSLKQNLFERYPEFSKLKSLSFAVGENYQDDSFSLKENDEVVIIPPVSGG